MSEWTIRNLDEVVEYFIDYRGKTPDKKNCGIPLITAKIVKNGHLQKPTEFISKEDYPLWMTRGYPEIDDVILTTEAPLGEVALLKDKNVALAQRIITLRGYKDVLDNKYLKYWMQSEQGQYELESRASGTTVFGIKASVLKKVPIPTPSFKEQKSIASVLSSLDDKIDLLHRQNKTLESMAETLFRQWFVEDVDDSSGSVTLGEMINIHDSKRIPLSKLERDKKKNNTELYPYYGAAKIMDYIDEYIFDGDYLLLGEDGTVQDSNGYPILQRAIGKFWVNNHAHVLTAKKPFSNFFLWCLLSKTNIERAITGAVQPKINQENLKKLDFVKFDENKVNEFNQVTESLLSKLNTNLNKIQTLEKLRDTLLPKLMSGEVRVQYTKE